MSYEIRHYLCPHCDRKPHIRFTEAMKDKIIEIECEFCLRKFKINERDDPSTAPDTYAINRK